MNDILKELCRQQEEKRGRQCELKLQRQAAYLMNQQKLNVAADVGLPILYYGGYGPCWICPKADHDTRTSDEDDLDRVICGNPACPEHENYQT